MKIRRAAVVVVAALAMFLTACSGAGSSDSDDSASGTQAVGTFPQTVTTAFGDVTINEAPKRVVALGWGDAETALALGVQPVGASDWLGFGGEGVGPWAEGMYDTAPTIIGTMEPSYEQIASLEPDLILDVNSSGDQDRYNRLSQIATTVGIPEGGATYMATMDQQVTMIATALGQPDKAKELLEGVDSAYQKVADAHSQWAGKTVTVATRTSQGWGAYVEGDQRVDALKRLGFAQNPTIAAMSPAEGAYSVSISSEQLDSFNADLIVAFPIFIDASQITDDAQWKELSTVSAGHSVVIDEDTSNAFSIGSVLATDYLLEHLVPQLEQATA